MPKYSVKKPFTVLVAVILVMVLGFVSLTGMQTDLLPNMNLPYLLVITTYPGASPEQVEADVTQPLADAAGIGKGTVYEYFSSKEEIIANAVLYDVEMRLAHVLEITKGEGDFAGKFVQILTYMEEVFAKRQAFCLLVRIGTGSYEVSESMRRECEKRQQALGCHLADRIVESLMCQGVSEGTIGETNPYLQKLAFVAQMTAFAGYLVDLGKGEKMAVSREEAKRFVYEALVKSLN